jgi:hypothetical protein
MPWIEPVSGDVGHGVGGGYASLNNAAFSLGGVGGWRNQNKVAFANGNDSWLVSTYDKTTKQIERVQFPSQLVINAAPNAVRAYSRTMARAYADAMSASANVPANTIYAGGDHVACWLGSKGDDRGLYTTFGMRLPDAGLMGMGPDAAVGYKPLYQSNGPTNVREANGDDWQLTFGHAAFLTMYGARRNMWQENFVVSVTNLPQPQVYYDNGGGVWSPSAAFVGGQWWIAYYSSAKGIVLHPFSSYARVYSILPQGDGWHRVSALSANVLRIAISKTEGEGPGDVWGYDIDVTTGVAIPLPFWQGGRAQTLPFVRIEDVNPAPAPTIPTFSFNHPVSTVVFKDPTGSTAAPAEILVNENQQDTPRQVFVADDSLIAGHWRGALLGIYTEAKGDALPKVVQLAASMRTRVLVCHDTIEPWTLPKGLRKWDIVAIETYRYPTESLGDAVLRWQRDVKAMVAQWPGDCGIVPMFYCMGGAAGGNPPEVWSVADVLDTQRRLSELVNLSSRIRIVMPFSYLRANGIVAHEELKQSYENLLQAAPHAPALTPVPDPVVPPKPTPKPYFIHKRGTYMTEIDGKTVTLRGPRGLLQRPDTPGTGIWKDADPKGTWRGSKFDVSDSGDARAHYVAKKLPNGRYTLTNVQDRCLAGEDAGWYTPDVISQFYHKPTDNTDAGDLEQWRIYEGNENGALEAQCEHVTDDQHPSGAGKKFFAYPLSVEVV